MKDLIGFGHKVGFAPARVDCDVAGHDIAFTAARPHVNLVCQAHHVAVCRAKHYAAKLDVVASLFEVVVIGLGPAFNKHAAGAFAVSGQHEHVFLGLDAHALFSG